MPKEEVAPRTIKVRALRTTYIHGNIRLRGDDTLGEGNGQVYELYDRKICKINPVTSRPELDKKTGEPIMILKTAEEQFSPINMERLTDDAEVSEEYISAQDAITNKENALVRQQLPKRKTVLRSQLSN